MDWRQQGVFMNRPAIYLTPKLQAGRYIVRDGFMTTSGFRFRVIHSSQNRLKVQPVQGGGVGMSK